MNYLASLRQLLTTPLPAATTYAAIIVLLVFVTGSSLADLLNRRSDVAASAAMLEQLESRKHATVHGQTVAGPAGSPFLEGATVTLAGAALLRRVTAAVAKFGGNVLSSQVDLEGAKSKAGFLSMIASCEIDQPGLQQLLYDIEAGMPFLFIDQLAVQANTSNGASGQGKLQILLTVSGQWQAAK